MSYKQKYIIKKGKHSSTPRRKRIWWNKDKFTFYITINKGWYPKDSIEHEGVSKLCGIAMITHAEQPLNKIPIIKNLINSCIIGYMCDYSKPDNFILYCINDNRGIETRPAISSVKLGETIKVVMKRTKTGVQLSIRNIVFNFPMNTPNFGYYMNPYHGGKSPAPVEQEVSIICESI